jgi:glycosyltransferase involved in cell wall biosynthesis
LYFSYLDAYPNVILEAQLAGLPVITNKGYGMVNQIIDGKNGLLIDLKKQASIKNSLGKLVRSKSKREMLGNNSNNKIIQENAPINVGKAFENIFYEVMNKRHSKYW